MKFSDQILLEQAYNQIHENDTQNFRYYSGPSEDIMFLENLDVPNLRRKIEEGSRFYTAFVAIKNKDVLEKELNKSALDPAFKKQLENRGTAVDFSYPDTPGNDYYIFDEPQDFTHAALIPM